MHKQIHTTELQESVNGQPNDLLRDAFLLLCESIASPKSLAAWLLFRDSEPDQFVELDCEPNDYLSSSAYADDVLVVKFLSKFPNLKLTVDPEAAAWATFNKYEDVCRITNGRFKALDLDPSKWDPFLYEVFHFAKRKIERVLGRPDFNAIDSLFGWGPGATSSSKKTKTTAYAKFSNRLDVTSNALVM